MMTAEKTKKKVAPKKPVVSKTKRTTFTCKYCKKSKPLTEMVVLARFFPPLVACKACEKTEF